MVGSGVRNQVAPSNRSVLARAGPRASAPQIGCPPTKRGSSPAAWQTDAFVEPASVTVAVVRREREHVVDDRRHRRHRNGDEDELRLVERGLERLRRRHGSPLGRNLEHSRVLVPACDGREPGAVRQPDPRTRR